MKGEKSRFESKTILLVLSENSVAPATLIDD
jgi:hypothetical protein